MDPAELANRIAFLERLIADGTHQLKEARAVVQKCSDANAAVSMNAAKARAENQGMG